MQGQRQRSSTINLAASALRGLGQFYDMQAETTRVMLRAQVRAASAFGLPDYSRLFDIEDDRARHLFSTATENLMSFVGQEEEILNEVPSQVFRMMEKQAIDATERWRYGLEELEQQATESVEELRELSRRQAEEFSQASESFTDAAHATMRESSEQYRTVMRQGAEAATRQSEAMRQELSERSDEDSEDDSDEGEEHQRNGGAHARKGSASRESGERSSRSHRGH